MFKKKNKDNKIIWSILLLKAEDGEKLHDYYWTEITNSSQLDNRAVLFQKYLNERQYFLNSFSYKINYSVSFWYNILYIYQGCQTNVFTRAIFFRLKLMEDRHKKPSVLRPDVENTKNVEAGFLKL